MLFWSLYGAIYAIVEYGILGNTDVYPSTQNYYNSKAQFTYVIPGSALLGLFIGLLEIFVFKKVFNKKSFSFKVIVKSSIYSFLIAFFLLFIGAIFMSWELDLSIFDPQVINSQIRFFNNFAFYSIFIYIGFSFIISLFIYEISKNLGIMVFYNFITGKYTKPRVEERIFMFLDIKSSTTIAEELGHTKYYELLNRYYSDMSDAILNTYGEIYQYVGDEVVVSWPIERGIKNNNCIRCFFEIKLAITSKEAYYKNTFGLVPGFKAGIHCGMVTSGEVGELKKEIVFSGDVLNTTSRIQEQCNINNAELLISQEILNILPNPDQISTEVIGEIELRGRQRKVVINKVSL